MSEKTVPIMSQADVQRALIRISHEIVERNQGLDDVALIGIQRRGVPMAKAIRQYLEEIEKVKIDDVEATAYHFTNERDTVIKILADKYGALYNFETNEKSYSNPDIQAILKSIKLKDIKEALAKENNQ